MANMDNESKCRIPLFNGTNYDDQKFRVETFIDEKAFYDYLGKPLDDLLERARTDNERKEIIYNATQAQWIDMKRILRYLKGTADIKLC